MFKLLYEKTKRQKGCANWKKTGSKDNNFQHSWKVVGSECSTQALSQSNYSKYFENSE